MSFIVGIDQKFILVFSRFVSILFLHLFYEIQYIFQLFVMFHITFEILSGSSYGSGKFLKSLTDKESVNEAFMQAWQTFYLSVHAKRSRQSLHWQEKCLSTNEFPILFYDLLLFRHHSQTKCLPAIESTNQLPPLFLIFDRCLSASGNNSIR